MDFIRWLKAKRKGESTIAFQMSEEQMELVSLIRDVLKVRSSLWSWSWTAARGRILTGGRLKLLLA